MTLGEIAAAVAEFAPWELAEPWDNVGLLAGDPAAEVATVVCCLDLDAAALEAAEAAAPAAVVAFHPPIFRPLTRLRADDPEAGRIWRALRSGSGLVATHTALDNAPRGTSDLLAEALGVKVTSVLRPRPAGDLAKLAVFVPEAAVDAVAAAMSRAGAGRIGQYAECGFRLAGTGTFRGLDGANPAIGQVGRLEMVDEIRLEMLVPTARTAAVVAAMTAAHPYEEVAYDLYPLLNAPSGVGLGRVGELPEPVPLGELADRVAAVGGVPGVRWTGDPARPVRRVAVLGGSGGGFVAEARRAGAEVLVTGDVKHHDALAARRSGLAVIDPGHAATELPAVRATAERLAESCRSVRVITAGLPGEPMAWRQG